APVRAIDLAGPDQELRMAEFVTRALESHTHGLTVKKAGEKLGLHDKRDILPGMEVRLLPHQVIGVSWMIDKEKGRDKGGILADDMGLGKTVQMIATMAINMPAHDTPHRTTLIVVPAALLQQWKDEIDTKTNELFEVHIYHGKDKLKSRADVEARDVVITSYQTLNSDFAVPRDIEEESRASWLRKNGGPLARTHFYRVIADEAQFIRNRTTQSSLSLAYVRADYRWCLTGTPVTNTLADIYGLLRFGKFRPWNDYPSFADHVIRCQVQDALLAGQRAQAILEPIIMRRRKDGMLEGEPLLQLPPRDIEMVELEFTPDEREIYDSFEKEMALRINKFIREDTVKTNHVYILVLILRLRQLCCHPNLTLAQSEELDDPTALIGSDNEKEVSRARKLMGIAWVDMVRLQTFSFLRRVQVGTSDALDDEGAVESCPVCSEMFMGDNGRLLKCGHEICADCLTDRKNSEIAHDGIFGERSEKDNMKEERKYEEALAKGWRPCPTCKEMCDFDKVFKSVAFQPTEAEIRDDFKRKAKKNPLKRSSCESLSDCEDVPEKKPKKEKTFEERGIDDSDDDLPDVADLFVQPATKRRKTPTKVWCKTGLRNRSDSDDDEPGASISVRRPTNGGRKRGKNMKTAGISDALMSTWSRGDDDLEPSTKMMKLISYIQEWDCTGDKIICYSQWTSMLDLIEILFSRYGIRNLRFDGKMNRTQRDEVLAQFKKSGGPRVMLISTKCGSVGLNLVSANRIVNMDLSWNYAAESQAYDRCHRIGQEKPVFVKRLVVTDTIEERMLKLQDVKTGLAEAALGEGSGTKLHSLSVKDIKYVRSSLLRLYRSC
ncbi:hypothetical protein FISHEDRAFT_50412, partial [Fistulina hepatica ATCC 64428]